MEDLWVMFVVACIYAVLFGACVWAIGFPVGKLLTGDVFGDDE